MEKEDVLFQLAFNNAKFQGLLSTTVEVAVTKALENYFPKKEAEPEWIDLGTVCKLLGRSRPTVYRLISRNVLTRHYINGLSPRQAVFDKQKVLSLISAVQFKYLQR